MSGFRIGKPAPAPKGLISVDHVDHLLLCAEPQAKQVSTQFGEADVAACSYVVCLDDGIVLADQLVYGKALAPRLTASEEEIIVGRLGQGEAKAGQSAPWILEDPVEADLDQVEKFLDRQAVRLPSGRIVIEPPSPPPAEPSY